MRWPLLVAVMWCGVALATDTPQVLVTRPCTLDAASCSPSKSDRKLAHAAFSRALKLEKAKHLDQAYREFDTAARLVPNNVSYVTALAMTREELVFNHVKQRSADLNTGREVEAQAEFRGALSLDPDNTFARERLQESFGQ